ncbi:MAG: 2-oxoacid:acceptor oxidoreductase subunit alpha [Planctomycetes bacterium]|nr:2-oxoacid:acceptor oxidoreductase subunit alpha [Planctomycetota bacterium]
MSQASTLPGQPAPAPTSASRAPIVNECSIQVATVNGSGSQTANNTLLRALFQMGIPVSGKNLFPSNISGLPTWFTIRANRHGYIARRKEIDVLVCMNPDTAVEDVKGVPAGAAVVYDEALGLDKHRTDVVFYPVPFQRLVKECCPDPKLRKLVVNMIYVGVVTELVGIDPTEVQAALRKAFSKKPKALELNRTAVEAGLAWAKANLVKRDPFRVERMDKTAGKILVDGNSACALGSMFAGVSVVTWYPITPSSSLCETLIEYMKEHRVDKASGKATFSIVQAEDELAALGMALGAGWAGARSMTSTSGPGISLMNEFIGLGYYAEVPVVIFDVQRTGPSTGLPTRTMQGDVMKAAYASHGDCRHPCLYPCDMSEAFDFAVAAFDLAETLQTPVFVMSDLDLGMNLWMSEPFRFPEKPLARGKVLDEAGVVALKDWGRYKDVDGDGIPYRTLPGTPGEGKAAYFARGSGHDEYARYTESGATYMRNVDRIARKVDQTKRVGPAPVVEGKGAKVGVLAYGTTHWAVVESRDQLRAEKGLATDYCRVRSFPFSEDVRAFVAAHERVYVVEQNRDAQMLAMLRIEYPDLAPRMRAVRVYNGLPADARSLTDEIARQESAAGTGAR